MIYALSQCPKVQEKLYEELKEAFDNPDKFTMAELNNLPYCDLVLKETLRLFPPVPFIGRKLIEAANFSSF